MNRADKLRKVVPGAPAELITALASRPAAEVDIIVALARQARRDEREHQAQRKRQRRADSRNFRWYDESQLREAVVRRIGSTGRRASADLEALASLAKFIRYSGYMVEMAVMNLRAQRISDEEIGEALGITRQAVGQRFGRKGTFTQDTAS
jgi:hypothetical protein